MINGIAIEHADKVGLRFDEFPQQARSRITDRLYSLTERLAALVRAATPKKTGRLETEIVSEVRSSERRIVGIVRVAGATQQDILKAAAEEYGSHRAIQVRLDRRGSIVSRLMRPSAAVAAAYTRTTNIDAVHYLRGPLDDMKEDIVSELRDALSEATNDGQ